MSSEDKYCIKGRLKGSTFTSFWSYNHNREINSIKNEQLALNNRSNN